MNLQKIYHCSACWYTFEDTDMSKEIYPARCPDCGNFAVWPADETEIEEYQKVQAEIAAEFQ